MYADGNKFSIQFQENYKRQLYAEARWVERQEATKWAMKAVENERKMSGAEVSQAKQAEIYGVEQNAENVVPLVSVTDIARHKAKSVSDYNTAVSILSQVISGYSPPTKQSIAKQGKVLSTSSINNNQKLLDDDDD